MFGVSAPTLLTGWSCWKTEEIGAYPAVDACAGANHRSCRRRRLCEQQKRHQTAVVGAGGTPDGCMSAHICAGSASFALGWLGVGFYCSCRCYRHHRRPWMAERTGHCMESALLFRVEFEATYAVVWERQGLLVSFAGSGSLMPSDGDGRKRKLGRRICGLISFRSCSENEVEEIRVLCQIMQSLRTLCPCMQFSSFWSPAIIMRAEGRREDVDRTSSRGSLFPLS